MCRICGVWSGFVLLMNLTYKFFKTSDLPSSLLNMHLMCGVSGPDLDDCSKNGKKAAEAMSLSKEGKSQNNNGKKKKKKCVCLNYCTYTLICKASINCTSAFLWCSALLKDIPSQSPNLPNMESREESHWPAGPEALSRQPNMSRQQHQLN